MRNPFPAIGLLVVFGFTLGSIEGCQPGGLAPADRVLMNGKILTVDQDFSVA